MSLFISNPSRQDAVFYYRRAITNDSSGPAQITIPRGGQVELGHNWTRAELDYVVNQIESQGGLNASAAHGSMPTFTGLLYRESKPVSVDEIVAAHEGTKAAAEKRSAENAVRGALAFDRKANEGKRGMRAARVTEVEVIQDPPPHSAPTGDEIHFGMSVDPQGQSSARGVPGLN